MLAYFWGSVQPPLWSALLSFWFEPDALDAILPVLPLVLILWLSAQADLVHTYTDSAAFVYGGISFIDKFTNGIGTKHKPNIKLLGLPCSYFLNSAI